MRNLILAIAVAASTAIPSTCIADNGGRLYAAQCAGCHGTNGQSVGDIDSIAGKSAKEIYEELKDMQKKTTTDNIMHRQAKGYTDQQIRELATYLASANGKSTALPK